MKEVQLVTIKVKYHADIPEIKAAHESEWIDLYAGETIVCKPFELTLISLGVSIELPDGYEAILAPRSSTYKNFGIVCACSFGVIDNAYKGDNDVWHFPAINTRAIANMIDGSVTAAPVTIHKGDRIAQFRIQKCQPEVEIVKVDILGNKDRGGIGSTGKR